MSLAPLTRISSVGEGAVPRPRRRCFPVAAGQDAEGSDRLERACRDNTMSGGVTHGDRRCLQATGNDSRAVQGKLGWRAPDVTASGPDLSRGYRRWCRFPHCHRPGIESGVRRVRADVRPRHERKGLHVRNAADTSRSSRPAAGRASDSVEPRGCNKTAIAAGGGRCDPEPGAEAARQPHSSRLTQKTMWRNEGSDHDALPR
jgi:hypothetical protein